MALLYEIKIYLFLLNSNNGIPISDTKDTEKQNETNKKTHVHTN